MATRIYRPDAGRSWREAAAVSANSEISTILARFSTDTKNRRLKKSMTTAEFNMKQAAQRTTAWAKAYEKVSGGIQSQAGSLQYQSGQVNQRAAEIQRLAGRLNKLTQAHEALAKQGKLTAEYHANYLAEWKPLNERYKQLKPIYGAQKSAYTRAAAAYEQDRQRLSAMENKYNRSTKSAKRAENRYKSAVKAYNTGFYPV